MAIKPHLVDYLGTLLYHVQHIQIEKDAEVHGEDAIRIECIINETREFEATYLKRLKLSDSDIAYDFSQKINKVLKGTIDEG